MEIELVYREFGRYSLAIDGAFLRFGTPVFELPLAKAERLAELLREIMEP